MDYYYYDDQLSEGELEHEADDDYEYDSQLLGEETFTDLYKGCIKASTQQVQQYIVILLGCGLMHRILWGLLKCLCDIRLFYHLISIGCGLLSLWFYVGPSTIYVFIHVLNICSFLRIILAMNVHHKGLWLCVYTIVCQLIAEYLLIEDKYETIRGPQMVVSMKMISVAFDVQDAKETYQWISFLGYLCSPSSLILGPWVSFRDYKQDNGVGIKRWQHLMKIILYVILSVIFLNLSNCMLPWLKQLWNGGLWYRTYLDAFSVRCSHYFICYLSQATVMLNCCPQIQYSSGMSNSFHIVRPMDIELPHSLSSAIRNWNIPMHLWLKNNIFQRVRSTKHPYFLSICTTYMVSCLVHGFNYKVHLVLVSLGLFSYFENNLRRTLAHVFNACIEASPCKQNCKYQYCIRRCGNRWYSPGMLLVRLVNSMFSAIVILQLAYLGIMLNVNNSLTASNTNILHVWSNLNYFGHWLALSMVIFYVAI